MADPKIKSVNAGGSQKGTSAGDPHGQQTINNNGKNGANGINGGNSTADKAAKAQSKIWQLIELAKDLSKDATAIHDFDKSAEERRQLDQELEARRNENKTLRELNDKVVRDFSEFKAQASSKTDTLFAEFEQKYKTYESNKAAVAAMEKEVGELRGKAAEADKLRQRAREAEAQATGRAAEVKAMGAECEVHRSRMQSGILELDACKVKLAEARGELGDGLLRDFGPDGLRKLGLELKALSKKCHNLVLEYFNDLDGAKDSASEILDLQSRFPNIPLTTATSRPAAQMRCAIAEAVISQILQTQIFTPFYLPNGARAAATSLLDDLFSGSGGDDDEQRRTTYRVQILTAAQRQHDAQRVGDDIVRRASNEARTTLHPLVVPFKQAGFYNAVPVLFREALGLWAGVQRSRELITAEAPDVNGVQPPGRYDDFDQAAGAGVSSSSSGKAAKGGGAALNGGGTATPPYIAAVFFPQVATREDLIFNGMALWSNQGALVAAAQDMAEAARTAAGSSTTTTSTPPVVKAAAGLTAMAHGGSETTGRHGGGGHARRKSVVASDLPPKGRPLMNGAS